MEKLVVEGRVEGWRSRWKSPSRWVDQLKSLLEVSLPETFHMAENRVAWRGHNLKAT